MQPHPIGPVPCETARIARLAFPKGNRYLTLRDELGTIYQDRHFTHLYAVDGHPAIAPWRLALICVMQFLEDLSDRQAAEAVRSRIDWKYLLGLELTDAGFDFSVLSEFRARLVEGKCEQKLLDVLLQQCKDKGWIKERGKQRTDSTHVLGAIRVLNRLELVGETLRAALNAIATVDPDWLQKWVPQEWYHHYGRVMDEYHLPKGQSKRQSYAEMIGNDGVYLLVRLRSSSTPAHLKQLPAVETLRQLWQQHYEILPDGQTRWRSGKELPSVGERLESPYDRDVRFGNKRTKTWTGYKVHLTETCEPDQLHLITQTATTPANLSDLGQTPLIHRALADKGLLPQEHYLDTAYLDAPLAVQSQQLYQLELVGPMRLSASWQAQQENGYDLSHFHIDWQLHRVTCPQGKHSRRWKHGQTATGKPLITVRFPAKYCQRCPVRALCTQARISRAVSFQPQAEQEMLQALRRQQQTPEWQQRYHLRAGIEGTLAQGIAAFGLRQSRYRGLPKTHLQHILISTAINVVRIVNWLQDIPLAPTRKSRFARLAPQPLKQASP